MRQTDRPEDVAPLQPPIRKPPMPKPHRKVAEGVWQAPDGKLYTNEPKNEAAKFTRSQRLAAAGYKPRSTWRSLPSDE